MCIQFPLYYTKNAVAKHLWTPILRKAFVPLCEKGIRPNAASKITLADSTITTPMQQQKIESKYQTQKKNIYIFICSSSLRTVVVVVVDIFLAIWVPIYVRHGEHDCVCLSMLSMHASVYALRLVARSLSHSLSLSFALSLFSHAVLCYTSSILDCLFPSIKLHGLHVLCASLRRLLLPWKINNSLEEFAIHCLGPYVHSAARLHVYYICLDIHKQLPLQHWIHVQPT